MPNDIIITERNPSLIGGTLLLPAKIIVNPFIWTIKKVAMVFATVIGYFVRIGIFPFGSSKSWFKKKLIETFKKGCSDTQQRASFDPIRLEQAFATMERVGGVRSFTYSKDGTKLDSMIIRHRDVKKVIESHGGKLVDCFPISIDDIRLKGKEKITYASECYSSANEYIDVIIPKGTPSEEWKKFHKDTLLNLGMERIKLTLKNGSVVEGFITKHWPSQNPLRPKPNQCFVRCNAPTESYAMAKRDILRRVLGAKSDVLCFDYRGTWKSQGVPTEGGYYLDAETMVDKAVHEYGYAWNDLWADGFCLGGAVAIHLKKKYHEKGINLFVQNTFDRMKNTLHAQGFPASHIAHYGLDHIKSRDPLVCSRVEQDCFDNTSKLEKIAEKKGTSIIINTNTDKTIQKTSHERLAASAYKASDQTHSLLFHHPDKKKNGHSFDVLGDRHILDKVFTCITAKDYPHILDDRPSIMQRAAAALDGNSVVEKLSSYWERRDELKDYLASFLPDEEKE